MNAVFLDTVGLVALWDRSDQWHTAAQAAFAILLASGVRLVSTPYVMLECGNYAARRPYRAEVVRVREELLSCGDLIDPTEDEIAAAWAAYELGTAGSAGIVDQVSFAVMRRLGLTRAFTNDKHFAAAGFAVMF